MGLDNPLHIAFLLFVVLIVFGAKRLPELGRSLGSGMRGFRDALGGLDAPAVAPTVTVEPALVAEHLPAGDPTAVTSAASAALPASAPGAPQP